MIQYHHTIFAFPLHQRDIYRAETIEEAIDRKAKEALAEINEIADRPFSWDRHDKPPSPQMSEAMFAYYRGMQNCQQQYRFYAPLTGLLGLCSSSVLSGTAPAASLVRPRL